MSVNGAYRNGFYTITVEEGRVTSCIALEDKTGFYAPEEIIGCSVHKIEGMALYMVYKNDSAGPKPMLFINPATRELSLAHEVH